MDKQFDIIIVGGGLNGATLALGFARLGLRSLIIDAQSHSAQMAAGFDGRSYAMALTSVRLLQSLGIWGALADQAQPMLKIKVFDGNLTDGPSPFHMYFDHSEIEEGPMGFMVEDRYLRRALLEAMDAEPAITQHFDTRVEAQDADAQSATLTLSNGRTLKGRLLVGADGRQSGTAQRAGIGRTGWGYSQTALVTAIAHEHPHNGVAHQFFMPPGPLAILPLPGNMSSIVWSESEQNAADIQALDDEAYLEVLRPRFGDFLGQISLAGKRFTYPLNLTLANSFVGDRMALVGDAAHGMHPIAGQGLNAGLRDVAALAHVLRDARHCGEDIGSIAVLERYQQWRRFDTATLSLTTDLTNKLFSNDNPLLRAVRGIGMGAVNALPALRRGLMREAAGLTGDLPALMRG